MSRSKSRGLSPEYFANLSSIVPIQPARRRGGNILDGMANALWNKHFVARLYGDFLSADGELEPSLHNGHQLVRHMDEIIPLPAGRVGKHVARVTAPGPVLSDLVTVERYREFLRGEVGH